MTNTNGKNKQRCLYFACRSLPIFSLPQDHFCTLPDSYHCTSHFAAEIPSLLQLQRMIFFHLILDPFHFQKKTLRSLDQRQSVNTLWFTTMYYFPHLQFFPEKLYMRGKKPRDYYDSNDFKVASKIEGQLHNLFP